MFVSVGQFVFQCLNNAYGKLLKNVILQYVFYKSLLYVTIGSCYVYIERKSLVSLLCILKRLAWWLLWPGFHSNDDAPCWGSYVLENISSKVMHSKLSTECSTSYELSIFLLVEAMVWMTKLHYQCTWAETGTRSQLELLTDARHSALRHLLHCLAAGPVLGIAGPN